MLGAVRVGVHGDHAADRLARSGAEAKAVAAPIERVPPGPSATAATCTAPSPGPITGLLVAVPSGELVEAPAAEVGSVVCTRSRASVFARCRRRRS